MSSRLASTLNPPPAGIWPLRTKECRWRDSRACAVVDNRLVFALGDDVVILDGGDRHDRAGSLDLADRDLGDADVPDLAAVAVLLDGGETLFERCGLSFGS